ncbi:DNA phosphorothioation-dependent restriction protein DptF [Pseudoalteromonas xiamenensis]|uniref:DNA phosphorothioation-dependent restriction protein DptF n=1 Tax=Pseudoalteromonas xiamenensis TaxID=882626 RepID=UPI0035E5375E
MRLKEALSVMSKSSRYAVSTEHQQSNQSLLDEIKSYLYIKMPIETDVENCLKSFGANERKVLFLCGSSGDGKSELLTKFKSQYDKRIRFHLDATHSFSPKGTAIQTLDNLFSEFESLDQSGQTLIRYPLVVGINTGMMANYVDEGGCQFIRDTFSEYLKSKSCSAPHVHFIDFEHYPKYEIVQDGYKAEFASKLLARVTSKTDENKLRFLLERERQLYPHESAQLIANFELLSIPSVQRAIVDLLFKARLIRDQFLTARALLDFIHELLAGEGYLFDNVFAGGANELADKIEEFDPAFIRSKAIDQFVLKHDLNLPDVDLDAFTDDLTVLGISNKLTGNQYIRLFYLLKYENFSNNYHHRFLPDFEEKLLNQFVKIHYLHSKQEYTLSDKNELMAFYRDNLVEAIRSYINRNAPQLSRNFVLLNDFGKYLIAAPAKLLIDQQAVEADDNQNCSSFVARFKLQNDKLSLPVNINLLNLINSINEGYRPNKNDKNSVILLDELANEIIQSAKKSEKLQIVSPTQKFELEHEGDAIVVSEV